MSMEGAVGTYKVDDIEATTARYNEGALVISSKFLEYEISSPDLVPNSSPSQLALDALGQAEDALSKAALREGLEQANEYFAEEVPQIQERVVFGKGVVQTHKSYKERTRDSIGSPTDRQKAIEAEYAATRAERRKGKRRGMVRVWAAADGYLPGQTPHDAGRWTAQIAKSTVAEQVDGSLEQDTAWILKSPFLQAAIDSRHQERQAESVENARADVASVFDAFPELTTAEADEAAKREKSEYFASQIARNQESPVVLVSIEEHLAAKLARATAIARTRQLRVTQFEKTDDSQGKKPEMRNPYLAEQPFAKGMERPSGYRADQAA